jgi:hypothetical protein
MDLNNYRTIAYDILVRYPALFSQHRPPVEKCNVTSGSSWVTWADHCNSSLEKIHRRIPARLNRHLYILGIRVCSCWFVQLSILGGTHSSSCPVLLASPDSVPNWIRLDYFCGRIIGVNGDVSNTRAGTCDLLHFSALDKFKPMMRHSHIEWTFLVKVHLEIISRENNRPTTYVQASVITDPFHELITATLVSYICLKTAFIIIPKNISPALRGSAHERRPPNAEVKYNTDLLLTIKKRRVAVARSQSTLLCGSSTIWNKGRRAFLEAKTRKTS